MTALKNYLNASGYQVTLSQLPRNTFVCHVSPGDLAGIREKLTPFLEEPEPGQYQMTVRSPERAFLSYRVIFSSDHIIFKPLD